MLTSGDIKQIIGDLVIQNEGSKKTAESLKIEVKRLSDELAEYKTDQVINLVDEVQS